MESDARRERVAEGRGAHVRTPHRYCVYRAPLSRGRGHTHAHFTPPPPRAVGRQRWCCMPSCAGRRRRCADDDALARGEPTCSGGVVGGGAGEICFAAVDRVRGAYAMRKCPRGAAREGTFWAPRSNVQGSTFPGSTLFTSAELSSLRELPCASIHVPDAQILTGRS